MSFLVRHRTAAQAFRCANRKSPVSAIACRRHLHEYLVMVNDTKNIQDLGPDIKTTFKGEVLSEEETSPRSIFACQAASIQAIQEALSKNGNQDLSAVKIFPLDTVHTSTLEDS